MTPRNTLAYAEEELDRINDDPRWAQWAYGAPGPVECPWCNEQVRVRKDGRLAVHKWIVGWDRERDVPIMGRCTGSGVSADEAWEAMH